MELTPLACGRKNPPTVKGVLCQSRHGSRIPLTPNASCPGKAGGTPRGHPAAGELPEAPRGGGKSLLHTTPRGLSGRQALSRQLQEASHLPAPRTLSPPFRPQCWPCTHPELYRVSFCRCPQAPLGEGMPLRPGDSGAPPHSHCCCALRSSPPLPYHTERRNLFACNKQDLVPEVSQPFTKPVSSQA